MLYIIIDLSCYTGLCFICLFLYVTVYQLYLGDWRGDYHLKVGTGMYRGHDPLFSGQSALPTLSIFHQCAAHVPPMLHFQPCFLKNFSSPVAILNFHSKDPHFSRKTIDPTFWKPARHIKKKKKNYWVPSRIGDCSICKHLDANVTDFFYKLWWSAY